MAVSTSVLSSLSQVLRARRHVYLLIFAFVFVGLFSWHGSQLSLAPLSLGRKTEKKIAKIQQTVNDLQWCDRPTCAWQRFHEERYALLSEDDKNVYIAMNFWNNEYVLPVFFQEFPNIVRRLGAGRIFVSIYENGSDDKTPEFLNMCACSCVAD